MHLLRIIPSVVFKCCHRNELTFNHLRVFRLCKNYSTSKMSKKTAVVLLSENSEEMEFVISVDVLRRAGIDVTVAGLQGNKVLECSRQVKIAPDLSFEDAFARSDYDVIVLPGGLGGSQAFCKSTALGIKLHEQDKSGKLIAAICAAPTALLAHEIGLGKTITCHPSVADKIIESKKYTFSEDRVVVDGNVITSRGPGTAFEFVLTIVEKLLDKDSKEELKTALLL